MRPAPKQFARDGYKFKQVWRDRNVAIYSQRRPGADEPAAWEVVHLRESKAHPRDANQESIERYPGAEEWGKRGWTYLTFQEAKGKALTLLDG